jgi:hypothetical protein
MISAAHRASPASNLRMFIPSSMTDRASPEADSSLPMTGDQCGSRPVQAMNACDREGSKKAIPA